MYQFVASRIDLNCLAAVCNAAVFEARHRNARFYEFRQARGRPL